MRGFFHGLAEPYLKGPAQPLHNDRRQPIEGAHAPQQSHRHHGIATQGDLALAARICFAFRCRLFCAILCAISHGLMP